MGGRSALGVALALLAFPLARLQRRPESGRIATTLQKRLGSQGVVDLDRRTGTPRVLARLDGTLTGAVGARARRRSPPSYVRANLSVLGLTAADFDALSPAVERRCPAA